MADDGRDIIRQFLNNLGLGSETDWAIQQIIDGSSPERVQIELEKRPAFQTRFPGYQQLQQEGRAISVAQWLSYEDTARGIFKAAGIPEAAYDEPGDIAKFITNNVSVAELQQRTQMAKDAVAYDYDPEMMRQLVAATNRVSQRGFDPSTVS